jgi:hypothetical protein
MGGGKRKDRENDDEFDPASEEASRIASDVAELSRVDLLDRLDQLTATWKTETPPSTYREILDMVFRNLGMNIDGDIDHGDEGSYGLKNLLSLLELKEIEVVTLFSRLKEEGILEDAGSVGKVRRIMEMLFYAKRIALSAVQSKIAYHDTYTVDENIDERLGLCAIRFRWLEDVKTSDLQKLIVYLLDICMERGYRKYGGSLYSPIIVDGHKTHAYERVCETKEFVHAECKKELNLDAFLQLTKVNTMTLVDHLNSCNDIQLPFLKKDRSVFSFRNGLYMCRTDTFVEYDRVSEVVKGEVVSSNYFDKEFDPSLIDVPWKDIPTPNSEKIFYDQKMEIEVRHWVYIVAGRMLYELKERDDWQVIPMLLGVAGSGKSTITDMLIGSIYDRVDVGVLSNNCEPQWAVSGLIGKLIWITPECKADFSLEQAIFQSMVSGERISVSEKFKTPYSTQFRIPGFLSGNVMPDWEDHSGSIQRRMLIFKFSEKIEEHDMMLGQRIRDELPTFIVKANKAYREVSEEHGAKNIWTILPKTFIEVNADTMAEKNPVELFIRSSYVKIGPGCATRVEEVNSVFRNWCSENGFKGGRNGHQLSLRGETTKYGVLDTMIECMVDGKPVELNVYLNIRVRDTNEITEFTVLEKK